VTFTINSESQRIQSPASTPAPQVESIQLKPVEEKREQEAAQY
jgi:hypothetical protein